MRPKVLSLFLAGAFAGVGTFAGAGDQIRAQSSWESAYVETDDEPGSSHIGTKGHFEEGTGPTSWYAPPDYGMYFKAGVQWLARSGGVDDQTLIVELPPLSTALLSTDGTDVDGQFRPGAIFTLGFNADQVSGVDLVYWGLQDYDTTTVISSTNPLGLAGTLQNATTDFIFANRIAVDYSSTLNNAEANYRQTIEGLTFLIGFRYFGVEETFNINSRNAILGTASDYNIETHNQLVGGQIGAGWGFDVWRFHFGVDTKFGAAANVASQETVLRDFGNTFVRRSYRAESMPTSWFSDTGVSAKYWITDWLAIETGYRFMWVANLALAPNQLDLSDSPAGTQVMDTSTSIYLNGLSLSMEARW